MSPAADIEVMANVAMQMGLKSAMPPSSGEGTDGVERPPTQSPSNGWIWVPSSLGPPGAQPAGPNQNDLGTFAGKVKSFNQATGYGFIECPELKSRGFRDVFLHHSQLQNFNIGSSVRFIAYLSPKGHPQAKDLRPEGDDASTAASPTASDAPPAAAPPPVNSGEPQEPTVVGSFIGVLKTNDKWNGFGFISSASLRASGHEAEPFVHKSQFAGFSRGAAVRFEAYVDEKGRLKARSLQSADADKIAVGEKVVTREKVESAGSGYLSVALGTEVEVLYIGMEGEEKDWLFVQNLSARDEGWLPATAVTAPEGCNPPEEKAMPPQPSRAPPVAAEKRQRAPPPPPPPGPPPPQVRNSQTRQGGLVPPPPPPPPDDGPPAAEVEVMKRLDLAGAAACAKDAGFKLLGASDGAPPSWEYPLCDVDRRCFVGLLAGALTEGRANELLKVVMDGMDTLGWEKPTNGLGRMSRGTKWLVKKGCRCQYRYGGVSVPPVPFPTWMQELLEECMPLCGLPDRESWPNCCNVNCYADGSDGIDWHADDEPLFQGRDRACAIISLSLGETRTFELRLVEHGDNGTKNQVRLRSGDIATMEGLCQRHYLHRVPKSSGKSLKLRVNLTWRWITQHDPRQCGL